MISFPSEAGLRPTADRVRETLFNWLGQALEGKTCLDLFAGSGALGFEACSRGARQVKLVENNPKVLAALRDNAQKLGAKWAEIIRADGAAWLRTDTGVYDVIFLDPPFQAGLLDKLLPLLPAKLSAEGCAYVESGTPIEAPPGMRILKSGRAGQVHFGLLAKVEHA